MRATILTLLLVLTAAPPLAAQDRLRVGLLPFDVANVDGGSQQAATAMAKLVRAEMITSKTLQPVLLELPAGAKLPLPEDQLASLASEHSLSLIIAGTILEATTSSGSNRISAGSLGARVGIGNVGGSMNKTKAELELHVELVNREGRTTDAFQVEGNNTDVGVGADIWTTLGGFDVGESSWAQSPMGKALREAAQKLTREAARRTRR
jgi:hypothetical protein